MAHEIPLTRGLVAIVDDDDYARVSSFKWNACLCNGKFYAVRWTRVCETPTQKRVFLHRFVTDAPKGMDVDHRDHDTLNCQKSNLRVCTRSQNMMNRNIPSNNTSGYKGVQWRPQASKWQACICVNGKTVSRGLFDNPVDAARAYDDAARKHFGEFARVNFPERPTPTAA